MKCGLEVRGQLCGIGFLLLSSHEFWGSCHRACMASTLIARPSHQPYCFIYNIMQHVCYIYYSIHDDGFCLAFSCMQDGKMWYRCGLSARSQPATLTTIGSKQAFVYSTNLTMCDIPAYLTKFSSQCLTKKKEALGSAQGQEQVDTQAQQRFNQIAGRWTQRDPWPHGGSTQPA